MKIKKIQVTMIIKIPLSSLTEEERKETATAFEEMRAEIQEEAEELGREGVTTSLTCEEIEE